MGLMRLIEKDGEGSLQNQRRFVMNGIFSKMHIRKDEGEGSLTYSSILCSE